MTRTRKPAGDLIEAIVQNMRANLEELRYSTIAPSRYTVLLSPAEHARLEGIIPRLQAETIRALDEQLAQLNRRSRLGGPLRRWFGGPPSSCRISTATSNTSRTSSSSPTWFCQLRLSWGAVNARAASERSTPGHRPRRGRT
jgi:hypothetical protein